MPNDGTVLLSDGTTAVYAGETLTVAQLIGLEFQPTAGLFGVSSTLVYSVTDPAGTTASGTATLAIGADTLAPTTMAASLSVAENAAATPIGIASPTDPNYAASQLTVAVTALPSDGAVLLSDGTTAVTVGEKLTVAQLTGLEFRPTAGLFGQSSSFTYSVTDPSGLTASGTATLAIGADTMAPTTKAASLSVAENAAATPIGIAAPTDPNYAASQLTVAVTALPSDGAVLLSDGTTAVTVGEKLTVAQLTGLEFRPTAGLSGQSSSFAYTVTNPSNLSANGSATVSVAAASSPGSGLSPDGAVLIAGNAGSLVTTDGTWNFGPSSDSGDAILLNGAQAAGGSGTLLEVANQGSLYTENSLGAWYEWVAGGWNAASDPKPATTSLPLSPDGSVLLAGGGGDLVTTAGIWTFSTATNSSGNLIMLNGSTDIGGSGTELAVAGGNMYEENNGAQWYEWVEGAGWNAASDPTTGSVTPPPPSTTPPPSTVSPDGSILLPGSGGSVVTTAGTWTFDTSTNSYGNLILLNGAQAADGSAVELEVNNQGNLYADNALGQWYEWAGGGWIASGDPTSTTTGGSPGMGSSSIYTIPALPQPSQTGDIIDVRLQNTGSSGENSGYVTFGQVFKDGALKPTDSLVARIGGVDYAVQMDVKATNSDGSVRDAILTLDAPAIAAGGTVDLMLAKGSVAAASPAAPSAAALAAGSYDVSVNFTFHNPDGTTTTDNASAAAALRAAIGAGTVKNWLAGPNVNEFDVTTTVDGGKLKVTFDIRAYAGGTTTTDVVFDNSWMFSSGKTDLNYDVGINQGGNQVFSAAAVPQYLYSTWHHLVASAGTVDPTVQYDVPYLEGTGALPVYDPSFGINAGAVAANLAAIQNVPFGTANVTTTMGETGGRDDIGTQTAWAVEALMSQNAAADQVLFANADAAGDVPWHYTDETSGLPEPAVNNQFWDDYRGTVVPTNGWPDTNPADPWSLDSAHQPDLNYLPYLMSGSAYQLSQLQEQAAFALSATNPGYGVNVLIDGQYPAGFVLDGINEIRAEAWDLREVAEAAYATPDSDPLKAYFTTGLQQNMQALVQQYLVDGIDNKFGAIQGFIGRTPSGNEDIPPWEEGYVVTVLGEVAGMNMGQASAQAVQMLKWMNNFVSGLWTNGANGYNPLDGAPYYLSVTDPTTGAPYTSWAQLYNANVQQGNIPGTLTGLDPNTYPTDTQGGYAPIAAAALATEITWTGAPQAMQAYGYVVSQIASAFAQGGGDETAAYQASPIWTQMPKLPDGQYLTHAQMQIDTSANNNVTLTGTSGDSLLSVTGGGSDTLNGGGGTTDLMYGGTGIDTFNPGGGNDYLFGGTGTNIFNDNTGNDYYGFAGSGNTLNVSESNSGHDTVFNYNSLTDKINIAANLNGNGITTTSQLLAGATVSNGNTVLHLGGGADITLLGIATPSTLANSVLVK